jgi:hypothetical protein
MHTSVAQGCTYRRYLAKALEQLTDLLWTVEIGEGGLAQGSTDVR